MTQKVMNWLDRWGLLLGVAAALIAAGVTFLLAPDRFIDRLAPIVQGASVVILVIVTDRYARSTNKIVEEAERTRHEALLPLLALGGVEAMAQLPESLPPQADIVLSETQLGIRWEGQVKNVGAGPSVRGSVMLTIGDSPKETNRWREGFNKKDLPALGVSQYYGPFVLFAADPGATGTSVGPTEGVEYGELIITYTDVFGLQSQICYPLSRADAQSRPTPADPNRPQGRQVYGHYRVGLPQVGRLQQKTSKPDR